MKLRVIYEQDVVRAQERLAHSKKLASEGLASDSIVEENARTLQSAETKLRELLRQIALADQDTPWAWEAAKLQAAVNAQNKNSKIQACQLTRQNAPAIRGLRIGQGYNDLQKTIPRKTNGIGESPDEFGVRVVYFSAGAVDDSSTLAGISSVMLTYFDDALVKMEITYDNSVKWQSNPHFVAAVAEQLRLPRHGWLSTDPSYLVCQDFVISASGAVYAPQLRIADMKFTDNLSKRTHEVEERKRARFRP